AHHRVWAGPNIGKGPQQLGPQFWQGYYGSNAFVDAEIGRVVDAIDQIVPESLVIYTSDHGDGLGSHAITNKGPAMYDEITRIPLIVRWPGHTPADQLCQYPVSHIDLAPTIMAAAGLPVPKSLEGRSMLATFQQPEIRPNESVFIEYGRYEVDHDDFGGFQPIRAACDGRYKLVINLLTTDEFYDLETDPGEIENHIDDPAFHAVRDRLHDDLLNWMNDTRDPFRGYYWERRPWRTDARSATWHYTGMTRQRENEEYEPRQLDYNDGLPMQAAVRKK
ncbi:sulfatase-like hydrolase/transferase, partial [bacterium]|nr:sulfatase-like hydrolase/transferase [bacterium]